MLVSLVREEAYFCIILLFVLFDFGVSCLVQEEITLEGIHVPSVEYSRPRFKYALGGDAASRVQFFSGP